MTSRKTIRLFVSSTFTDLKAERDALQRDVFPKLKQLCESKQFRFQAIDLRWGVSEEAGRRNQTMRICLRELRRCQDQRIKPNFLILLGERYGWRPLPEVLSAGVFDRLSRRLESTDAMAAQLLRHWYRVDVNAVPPVAELQPRGSLARWSEDVEGPLLAALQDGVDREDAQASIGLSAAEQEIIHGALNVADASSHVIAFFRTIDGLSANPPSESAADLNDPHGGRHLDALTDLKKRIAAHIGERQICRYRVRWGENGLDAGALETFSGEAWRRLSAIVEAQIDAASELSPFRADRQTHHDFEEDRSRIFVGREDVLDQIGGYLRDGRSSPLALVGKSGSGKSAVIAKAVRLARDEQPRAQVVARYIGATPTSSDLRRLLIDLVAEIDLAYPPVDPQRPSAGPADGAPSEDYASALDFTRLIDTFHTTLARATAARPLFLFIDALDQLTASHEAQALAWLPKELPPHVRIVVSAALRAERSGASSLVRNDPRVAVSAALTARIAAEDTITLGPMTDEDGEKLLTNWLDEAHRALQSAQRQAVADAFAVERNPLWLRAAANEAVQLASWEPAPVFPTSVTGLLRQVLKRLSLDEEHGAVLVSHTFSYLACARYGLPESELLEILSADPEVMADFRRRSPAERGKSEAERVPALPVAVWVRLYGDISFYLAEYDTRGVGLLGFYHRSFPESLSLRGSAADWHRPLARYFRGVGRETGSREMPRETDRPGVWRMTHGRALGELAYHLRCAGDLDELGALYADPGYIDARCRSFATSPDPAPDVLEFLNELREASSVLTVGDPPRGELISALVRLLIDRNALLTQFPENAAQEIANYFADYSQTPDARAVAAAARKIPTTLALRTRTAAGPFTADGSRITALAVAPSGREFLSGAEDGSIGYWNVFAEQPTWVVAAHEEFVTSIVFSRDGQRALTAGHDGAMFLWDLALASHRAFRPIGEHLFVGWVGGFVDEEIIIAGQAGVVFTFNVVSGRVMSRSKSESDRLPAISPDLRSVCLAGGLWTSGGGGERKARPLSHALHVHEVGTNAAVQIAELPRPPRQLLFTQQGDCVLVSDGAGYISEYSARGGCLSQTRHRSPLASWCRMDDGTVVAADCDGALLRLSFQPLMTVQQFPARQWDYHAASVVAALPHNRVLAGHDDGSVTLVDLSLGFAGRRWLAPAHFASGALLGDGSALGVTGTNRQGESVIGKEIYSLASNARVMRAIRSPHARFITGVAGLEKDAVTVDRGGTAAVWHGTKPIRVHQADVDLTCCAAWMEGDVGVAGTAGDEVRLIGRGDTMQRIALPARLQPPGVSAVAAAGRPIQIIAAFNNSEVASAGQRQWREKARTGMGTAAALDPSRRLAATGHAFGTIHLWDADSGAQIWRAALHSGPVAALAFGADGLLYSAGVDRRLIAVDVISHKVIAATMLGQAAVAMRAGADGLAVLDSAAVRYQFGRDDRNDDTRRTMWLTGMAAVRRLLRRA